MKKFENREQCIEYVQGLSVGQLTSLCVDLLMRQERAQKIQLTQEQFEAFFKVQGLRAVPETRGRKSK